jgi:hypothetical protein
MQIQAYLTATVINLKRLAAALLVFIAFCWCTLVAGSRQVQPQPL